MLYNLPDCMYDYRPDRFEDDDTIKSDTYCERCGKEVTNFEYESNGGYCDECYDKLEEEYE